MQLNLSLKSSYLFPLLPFSSFPVFFWIVYILECYVVATTSLELCLFMSFIYLVFPGTLASLNSWFPGLSKTTVDHRGLLGSPSQHHISESVSRPRAGPSWGPSCFISLLPGTRALSMSENSYFKYFVEFSGCYGERLSLALVSVSCPAV